MPSTQFDVLGIGPGLKLRQELTVKATADDGKATEFKVICRIDTYDDLVTLVSDRLGVDVRRAAAG